MRGSSRVSEALGGLRPAGVRLAAGEGILSAHSTVKRRGERCVAMLGAGPIVAPRDGLPSGRCMPSHIYFQQLLWSSGYVPLAAFFRLSISSDGWLINLFDTHLAIRFPRRP